MKFAKAHSFGNDFVLITAEKNFSDNFLNSEIQKIGHPKFGISCDQVIAYNELTNHVSMFNFDGSSIKMCMNGLRSIGAWLCDNKNLTQINVSIEIGNVTLTKILQDGNKFNIGLEIDQKPKIEKINDAVLNLIFLVNIGVFHEIHILETEPDDISSFASLKHNVSVVWKKNDENNNPKWHARTIELIVGETLACGSAAFSIAHVLDEYIKSENLDIYYKFGKIEHKKENGSIKQIGLCEIVAKGNLCINL